MSQYTHFQTIPLFENFCRKSQVDGKQIEIKLGNSPILAKVATTPLTQAKGYMGEKNPPKEGEGMLFVYDEEQPLSFWMKNVGFPLDIVFFDSSMNYVDHLTMEPDSGVPDNEQPRYSPKRSARFAVELPSGWCDKNLEQDCKLSF